MINDRLTKIIISPCVTEKSTGAQAYNQYVFRVEKKAKKNEIARAIKLLFDVEVDTVRVCNVKGKKRSFKNVEGKCKNWKKAYVTVKEGQAINLGGA